MLVATKKNSLTRSSPKSSLLDVRSSTRIVIYTKKCPLGKNL